MHLSVAFIFIFIFIFILAILALAGAYERRLKPLCPATIDYALPCYSTPLPALPPTAAAASRSIPWGSPSFILHNGTLCCNSLTEVRDGIDAVDGQISDLLAQKAGYVKAATRFKSTIDGELFYNH